MFDEVWAMSWLNQVSVGPLFSSTHFLSSLPGCTPVYLYANMVQGTEVIRGTHLL